MKNYRVLVADDEYWGRENLRYLIPWEEYGLEFLEPACDGEEVLERIPEDKPDIIFTDINMPFLGGLDLLGRLRSEYPEIITVAVSGYDDFEKVKGVFISGGVDYLLKPVAREELVEVLKKVLGILQEREAQRTIDESSRLQADRIESFMEDGEYSALLSGQLYKGAEALPQNVRRTDFGTGTSAVLIKFYDITRIAADCGHDISLVSWNIKRRLQELYRREGTKEPVLFNYSVKMSEFLLFGNIGGGMLQKFARQILDEFPLETYGPLSVVLREGPVSLEQAGAVYREMSAALVMRPFGRSHCILRCAENGKNGTVPITSVHMDARLEEELYRRLVSGERAAAAKLIFNVSGFAHCGNGEWSCLEVKQYVSRVMGILSGYVQNRLPELSAQMEEFADNLDFYVNSLDAAAAAATMQSAFEMLWGDKKDTLDGRLENIHSYIEKNYREDITLTSLAKDYHVNASYLSRSFSKKYKETIIAFLTRTRIEHAAKLISGGDQSLEAISFLVGYDDYNYFSRVFRKKTGVSPSEYRKKSKMCN